MNKSCLRIRLHQSREPHYLFASQLQITGSRSYRLGYRRPELEVRCLAWKSAGMGTGYLDYGITGSWIREQLRRRNDQSSVAKPLQSPRVGTGRSENSPVNRIRPRKGRDRGGWLTTRFWVSRGKSGSGIQLGLDRGESAGLVDAIGKSRRLAPHGSPTTCIIEVVTSRTSNWQPRRRCLERQTPALGAAARGANAKVSLKMNRRLQIAELLQRLPALQNPDLRRLKSWVRRDCHRREGCSGDHPGTERLGGRRDHRVSVE